MTPKQKLLRKVRRRLDDYLKKVSVGPQGVQWHDAFAKQLVDSERRRQYVERFAATPQPKETADPFDDHFHPIRGSVFLRDKGDLHEAKWLCFLASACGKHKAQGWGLVRRVYSIQSPQLSVADLASMKDAVATVRSRSSSLLHVSGTAGFGNHRKYESVDPNSRCFIGFTLRDYAHWALPQGGHDLIDKVGSGETVQAVFNGVQSNVSRFGRTAAYDYVTLLARTGLMSSHPEKAELKNATGPLFGARLMFPAIPPNDIVALEQSCDALCSALQTGHAELEDALCNWQKSPHSYVPFRL